jgi:hypothetical protein
MFPLGTHNDLYPHIEYVETLEVTTQLLKNIIPKYRIPFNFLALDIQGAELKALPPPKQFKMSMVFNFPPL